jgi:hypothetical protein
MEFEIYVYLSYYVSAYSFWDKKQKQIKNLKVIIVILVITAGLKNSARSWRIKRANLTSFSHQRGRSSPILVSSIKIASTRNNKTAAALQSLNRVKPKW